MPAHPVALALLRAVDFPIAAPSANPFGYVSPTTAAHVRDSLGDEVDLIIDGGPCQVGVESTVCALTDQQAVLLRPGGVTLEQIESVIGPVRMGEPTQADRRSPGTLLSHYAPRVPVVLLKPGDPLPQPEAGERLGLLSLTLRSDAHGYTRTEALSQDGNLLDAAVHSVCRAQAAGHLRTGSDRYRTRSRDRYGPGHHGPLAPGSRARLTRGLIGAGKESSLCSDVAM